MEGTIIETSKKSFDWYTLIAAAVQLLVGLTILIWPGESRNALAYVIACAIMLAGLARMALYFSRRERVSPFSFGGLSLGLSLTAVGLFFLLTPEVLISLLPVVLGCLLIFSGFGSLQTAVELMRLKACKWYIPLFFALAALVCGFVALLNPFATAKLLMVFLGISLCGEAALLLASLILFRQHL